MTCDLCGDHEDDVAFIRRCDVCRRRYCDDCAPVRTDDAPIDVCVDCATPDAPDDGEE